MLNKAKLEPVELRALEFSIRSAEEIIAASAFELTSHKLSPAEYGTVTDPRGGATRYSSCETCLQSEVDCMGHFGFTRFDSPVMHPLFLQSAVLLLRVLCQHCHRLLFNAQRLSYANIDTASRSKRLERINALLDGRGVLHCAHCGAPPSQYVLTPYNPKPGSNAPKTSHLHRRVESPSTGVVDIPMSDVEIATILEDVPKEDVELLGVDPSRFLVRVWPVIPLRCTKQKEGTCSQTDDLISLLRDMVKLNIIAKDVNASDLERIIAQHELAEKLNAYVSNSENRKSSNADRGKPIASIVDRVKGKRGLIRNNLMGKRSVMTARTVIGPDPTLRLDEVSVSQDIAKSLTIPVSVYPGNVEEAKKRVANGNVVRAERGTQTINVEMAKSSYVPKEGDVIHCYLREGDWIMMNRQPTLHRGSMIAFKIKIRNSKTFGLNLATTKSFNADFDGDNMNGMVPQSTRTTVELAELSSVKNALVIGTRANISIVQDSLTAVYLMSKEVEVRVPKSVVGDVVYAMAGSQVSSYLERLERYRRQLGKPFIDSRMLVSLAFPENFSYASSDGELVIDRGLILKGLLTKRWLGANRSSLIKLILFRYKSAECCSFVDRLQFGATAFLMWRGFSVHADDFLYAGPAVEEAVSNTLRAAEEVQKTIKNPRLREARTREVLDMAKDVGMKLVRSAASNSNIATMIESGSKGDFFNAGQIRGTLGQQTLDGGSIKPDLNGGTRTTVHYHFHEKRPAKLMESRGFISSGFARGLSPREIVFHAMTGREGVCTSATLTAESGYTARRVNKFLEDIHVRIDGTVGDRIGNIYSFAYNGCGINPAFDDYDLTHVIEKVGGVVAAPSKRRPFDMNFTDEGDEQQPLAKKPRAEIIDLVSSDEEEGVDQDVK